MTVTNLVGQIWTSDVSTLMIVLASFSTADEAILFIKEVKHILDLGGFNLTKWNSNVPEILQTTLQSMSVERIIGDKSLNDQLQRTLGIDWDTREDVFRFKVKLMDRPVTRRGVLAYMASLFDPMGFAAPILLPAKLLLQRLCKMNVDWDSPLPDVERYIWDKWLASLKNLSNVFIKRCLKPKNFDLIQSAQLHLFADASQDAYGIAAYIRLINVTGQVHCCLVFGKSRVSPLKPMTIPRMELVAAALAAKISKQIKQELDIRLDSTTFWSDSMIVLQSIRNTDKRFQTFVANRLAIIHESSKSDQWRYVETKSNPADLASRGFSVDDNKKLTFG